MTYNVKSSGSFVFGTVCLIVNVLIRLFSIKDTHDLSAYNNYTIPCLKYIGKNKNHGVIIETILSVSVELTDI